ncbi:MAG TPA: glycosyltransferase family A protein [Thermoleophilaceae bacterium]|nr:glycosyltransferase family A protein [Thermoleophilaceae bacterium]
MTEPEVSVIVPARNAVETLPRLFDALDRSTFEGEHEVILVDDGSTDGTPELARERGAAVVSLQGQGGPAQARNAGLEAARGPLIAFTDADCEPCAQWLSEVVAALRAGAGLVRGPVKPDPRATVGPYDRTLWIDESSPLFETANLAVTRAVADRVGGFIPFAPGPGAAPGLRPRVDEGHFGEDVVFGWSARRAGARVVYAERALVHHAVFPRGPRGFIAERRRLRFFPALVREIPELRGALPGRYFLATRSAQVDLAVAGVALALARRRVWPLAAVVPYATARLQWRSAWRRSVARRNLAYVAADGVGLVALVRGSLAARRLLL